MNGCAPSMVGAAWSGCVAPVFELDEDSPVPLVTFGDICAYHRLALRAFNKAQAAL